MSRSPSSLTQIQEAPYGVSQTFKKMPGSKSSEIDGAWELVRFENITGADTSIIQNKQYKVYQDGHLLWVHRYPSHSVNKQFQTGYGFGLFSIKDNTITETITSSNYKEIIEAPVTVSFNLVDKDQLLLESGDGISITKETYRRVN